MNALKKLFFRGWRLGVLALSLALIAYLLYFHRLNSLLPGYSAPELRAYANSSNWHTIATDPIDAPYKIMVWLGVAVLHHGILTTRVVAAGYGIAAVLTFFTIIRHWYTFRTVFLSTILFATSSGLLHIARFGTSSVLQMAILAFISSALWYKRKTEKRVAIGYWLAALLAILCYIPGMLWFELFGVLLVFGTVRRQLRQLLPVHIVGWSTIFLIFLAPLVIASIRDTHLIFIATDLPQSMHALTGVGTHVVNAVMSIAVRSNGNPLVWVGHAPLLNIIELVLLAIGAYYYFYQQRTSRGSFLMGSLILSLICIGFSNSVSFASLVPLLYLLIAGGLHHLLEQWLTVFPRNPIARYTGVGLVCVMLFFSVLYQTRAYFVAWPHNAATRQVFSISAPD